MPRCWREMNCEFHLKIFKIREEATERFLVIRGREYLVVYRREERVPTALETSIRLPRLELESDDRARQDCYNDVHDDYCLKHFASSPGVSND